MEAILQTEIKDIVKHVLDCLLGIIKVPVEQLFDEVIAMMCKFAIDAQRDI
jgi:hypothetical protein